MIEYIKKAAKELINTGKSKDNISSTGLNLIDLANIISEEISRLDPLDFSPARRYEFVILRKHFRIIARLRGYGGNKVPRFIELANDLIEILDHYGTFQTGKNMRNFSFIHNMDLRAIIERDYAELSSILLPDGAWKSCVIMSGSILESILYDVLTSAKYKSNAVSSSKAPKTKGKVKDIDKGEWKLVDLINVAVDIRILTQQRGNSIDQVLRDFRNFVHPKKEIKSAHPCTEAEALLAKGGLDVVCNHFEKIT